MLQGPARRNYMLLSAFVYCFFFAQAAATSLLAIWLTQSIKLTGTQVGAVFSANFVASMISQPLYGYFADRMGYRRVVPAVIACLVVFAGPFFAFVYAPLLHSNLILGAIVGGLYTGITFFAGSYAIETYLDRVSRRDGFEYSRVRLWGSLGFASAALFSGRLYNIEPSINFYLATVAGMFLLALLFAMRNSGADAPAQTQRTLRIVDSLGILRLPQFWRLMVLILGVTNLYLVYDQQFPHYFASMFATPAEGNAMFGYLNSGQIFVEAGMMFLAPILVRRIGAKNGLLFATAIMIVRIGGSGLAIGPLTISACKMLHSLELPILIVSVFRYINFHFETRMSATIYMVGVSFGHSLGLALLSPVAGLLYDRIGFQHTYFAIAGFAFVFWLISIFALSPTPPADASGNAIVTPESDAALATLDPAPRALSPTS